MTTTLRRNMTSTLAVVCAGLMGIVLSAPTARGQTPPQITDMGLLPGVQLTFYSSVSAVSDDGASATGMCWPDNAARPYRWTRTGGMQDLGFLNMTVRNMSADGSIIAGDIYTQGQDRAFLWTASGGLRILTLPSAYFGGTDFRISPDGSALIGSASSLTRTAVLWTPSGGFQELESLPSSPTPAFATGIAVSSGARVAVGLSNNRPVRWTQGQGIQDLGLLPNWNRAEPTVVSADGRVIAGNGHGSSGTLDRMFQWIEAGSYREIPALPMPVRLYENRPNAINWNGTAIVGTVSSPELAGTTAFLWTNRLGTVDLRNYVASLGTNVTGWIFSSANAISSDGTVIAGAGSYLGLGRAFVITGLPRPCLSDFNNVSGSTVQDVFDFLAAWFSNDLRADFNASGDLSIEDVFAFITEWFVGC
jgi:uncharacterized membrane protein